MNIVWFVSKWIIRTSNPFLQQRCTEHLLCTSESGTGGITVNKAHRSLCPKQLPFSWGHSWSCKIYLVLDGDGVMKKRKEGKRDGEYMVLLFYSVALAV